MRRAVEGLRLKPARVLVDGNRVPVLRIPAEAIVGGDAKVQAISAASILAKVYRDRLCLSLDEAWPQYGFAIHKGYPTAAHLAALNQHGPCPEHRRSYAPVRLAELGARGGGGSGAAVVELPPARCDMRAPAAATAHESDKPRR
jgi:ribonuclease HII